MVVAQSHRCSRPVDSNDVRTARSDSPRHLSTFSSAEEFGRTDEILRESSAGSRNASEFERRLSVLDRSRFRLEANQLKFVSRAANAVRIQRYTPSLLENDDDEEQRWETLDFILKFLLKLLKDVFIFDGNEVARHFLQLRASIEVLRLLEIPEIFHRFAPTDYVELFSAATVRLLPAKIFLRIVFSIFQHQNALVRHRFLQRVLQKVSQFKISVLFLGLTIAVPNDDEDSITMKNLKSVMERLYLLASKGSGQISVTRVETSNSLLVF